MAIKSREEDFTIIEKSKILSSLNEMFRSPQEILEQKIVLKRQLLIKDAANVVAIFPRTKRAKMILSTIASLDDVTPCELNITYCLAKEGSKYSSEHLYKIFDFFKSTECDSIKIITAKDIPIKIMSEDFGFILAPRVE